MSCRSCVESFKKDFYNKEKDEDEDERDEKAMENVAIRAHGYDHPNPNISWGGGTRRMVHSETGFRKEDEHYKAPRYVPIGFDDYERPTIDPADYAFYYLAGWRVAVPIGYPAPAVKALLLRIYKYGPQSSGYARIGDTLVPAILGPGDRKTLESSGPPF